ncbi:hypothetical protein CAMRE0001_0735 [Campylobacter rectus RM3267]|uniref:Uncharacterized protein n=1 Tax=Campylobacter rectus RM3267 TaxID=553218 RepID=B9CZP4_CAMRE|nr:hypothetical protein CAMRE0001_0735 [Campylobacter rectus RM3267]
MAFGDFKRLKFYLFNFLYNLFSSLKRRKINLMIFIKFTFKILKRVFK